MPDPNIDQLPIGSGSQSSLTNVTPDSLLGPLDNYAYNFSSMSYPIDLGNDPANNHYVLFYINETTGTNYPTGQGVNINGQPTLASDQKQTTKNQLSTIDMNIKSDAAQGLNNQANIPRTTTRVPLGIALYMPPQLESQMPTPWSPDALGLVGAVYQDLFKNDAPFLKKLQQVAGDMAVNIGSNLLKGAGNISDILFKSGGAELNALGTASLALRTAVNPHAEVLFRGINFRGFNFKWQFFPRSKKEAQAIYNIIQAFKFYAAPEINTGLPGRYWLYPAEFDIKFFSNGQPNTFLNKISTCALVNVTVNYTGNGIFSSFVPDNGDHLNGVPTETQLSLDFIELEVMHKKRILEGY